MKRKLLSVILATAMTATLFAGCGNDASNTDKAADTTETGDTKADSTASGSGSVYYLNFKPEQDQQWQDLAAKYQEETGTKVTVITAADGTYEQTLKSEMAKKEAPTLFQVNGPVGLANWKDYCMDLSNSELYSHLTSDDFALKDGDAVQGIAYVVETYGLIYNKKILNDYCTMDNAVISSVDEINNFATLKAVVEDMQAKKDQLGIKGVFASTSFGPGQDWRWQTHLMNIALYGEFKSAQATLASKELAFTAADKYQAIFDLYTNNSTTAKGLLGSKSVDDSMAEFALGQCAMVQNGNWGAGQILGVPGNTVANEDIKFLPIYAGLDGEEHLGLCVGTENYLCINKNLSAEDQANADKFLTWLFSSATGKKLVSEKLGFITPFNSFAENELPADPLAKEVNRWMVKDGITSIPWCFTGIPSEQWKSDFGGSLLQYLQGSATWADCVKVAKDSWAKEAKIAGR